MIFEQGTSSDQSSQGHWGACCLMSMGDCAGDAVMGMIVTHLVVASTSSGDCETLHNRRKIMVIFCPKASLHLLLHHMFACKICPGLP